MGAFGNWISGAWKDTVGAAWDLIGINQAWEAIGATSAWENMMDNFNGYENETSVLESDSSKKNEFEGGISVKEDVKGSSGVEEKDNVGGVGSEYDAELSNKNSSLASKNAFVGSGINTFGFTQDDNNSGVKTKKLGA